MSNESPENMSFEQALGELEAIVQNLESGKAPLEESIKSYERGIALKTQCEKKLREAQEKIEKITISPDGSLGTEPFAANE
ncbi:MAG: exodeoxyribonuclease VII small subunit [Alphaproteobacteria bacterium]|nr:exodeoxyribonuclease VII small subunit [Alphaproteobacteria bacterium]